MNASEFRAIQGKEIKPRRVQHEAREQRALIDWRDKNLKNYAELRWLHAIPNGGLRNRATARMLKAEGVQPGVPDLFLPLSRAGFSGCYIEMKIGNNQLSEHQKRWIRGLVANGFLVAVCYSWIDAADTLKAYLKSDYRRLNDACAETMRRCGS